MSSIKNDSNREEDHNTSPLNVVKPSLDTKSRTYAVQISDEKDVSQPRNPNRKKREQSLQAICKQGVKPLTMVKTKRFPMDPYRIKPEVEIVDHGKEKGYICVDAGPMAQLAKWLRERTRVNVKLRAESNRQEPNRLLTGAVVAFDKHWNLIMRDVDEVYIPAVKLGKVQTSKKYNPEETRYTVMEGRVLNRHLECSFITGCCVISINCSD